MAATRIYCHTFPDVGWVGHLPAHPERILLTVYSIRVSEFTAHRSFLETMLLPDELDRGTRYRQAEDRHRFFVARSLLRALLGQYTGLLPQQVRFGVGIRRKPILTDSNWHFNISHAGDQVLIAIGDQPMGVDVERVTAGAKIDVILTHTFSPDEQRFVGENADKRPRFYRLWTRKEALAKATAKGIDDDFGRIPSLDGWHDSTAELIGSGQDWAVGSFEPADGYIAALAYAGRQTTRTPVFCRLDPASFGLRDGSFRRD